MGFRLRICGQNAKKVNNGVGGKTRVLFLKQMMRSKKILLPTTPLF